MNEEKKLLLNLPKKEILFDSIFDPGHQYLLRDRIASNRKPFRLMFGPPFTSGKPHLGTLYSEIMKEIVCSCIFTLGKRPLLKPGFDCFGLPTENLVRKETTDKFTRKTFFDLCRKTSKKNLISQVLIFKKFDLIADWDSTWATASIDYCADISKILRKIALRKKLKLGFKEFDFCTTSQSIVPLSEISQKKEIIVSLTLAFKDQLEDIFYLSWTTTPWSLSANSALAFNPNLKYGFFKWKEKKALALISWGLNEGLNPLEEIEDIVDFLKNKKYISLDKKERLPFLMADWVKGKKTGLVHIAGRYDIRDFNLSLSYSLPLKEIHSSFEDVDLENKRVISKLEKIGVPLEKIDYETEQNYFDRTGKKTIGIVSKQFFLDTTSSKSKALFLSKISKMNWEKHLPHISKLILRNKEDWCLSRNRTFNSPLTFNPWSEKTFEKMSSIGWVGNDVWFDSACSIFHCYGEKEVDLIMEGVDQYKGYFLRLLQISCLADIGYTKKIISTGFVVDGKGNKLSKSRPISESNLSVILKEYGPDIFKLWASHQPFFKDVPLSFESLNLAKEQFKKIKNHLLYLSGYWEIKAKRIPLELIFNEEKWILSEFLIGQIKYLRFCANLKPQKALEVLLELIDLNSFYLNQRKHLIYSRKRNSPLDLSFRTTLSLILESLVIMLRSFCPRFCFNLANSLLENHLWNLNFNWRGFNNESLNRMRKSLSILSEYRIKYEKAVKSGLLERPWNTKLISSKIIDSESLSFLSFWKIEKGDKESFEVDPLRCKSCRRYDSSKESQFCKSCQEILI